MRGGLAQVRQARILKGEELMRKTVFMGRDRRVRWTTLAAGVLVPAALALATSAIAASKVHRVTLVMKEFKFEPARIQLKVGETVDLTIRNTGQVSHDWMAGRGLVNTQDSKGFQKDLLALLKPTETGRQYAMERVNAASKADLIKRISEGTEIEPGGEVTLRFTVPASAKGEWQMACVLTGHFESGMKGTIVIR
jgi:uncharacterized cupredoxin-like copper-binding protein